MARLQVGDSVGGIYNSFKDGKEHWELIESKINKIMMTQRTGRRYYTKDIFSPLDADDVDLNTEMMEEAEGKGYILTSEVFGLNDITRPFAERWVKWANENNGKAVSILS